MPARTLYSSQIATIDGKQFPVQSASCETTIPVEDIVILGKLGSAGRFQKEVATCKSDIKIFLASGTGNAHTLTASIINTLTGNSMAGTVSDIRVVPNGFGMSGILSSLSIDASKGNFVMVDMSFVGVGEPAYDAVPTTIGGGQHASALAAVTPIINQISLTTPDGSFDTCPRSAKFSFDMPNEVISCINSVISGAQSLVTGTNVQVAKPPFKGTIAIEGTSAEQANAVQFGHLKCQINDAKLVSRNFNQGAGEVGATYNFNSEGVDVTFSDQTSL
jgi:hypothetical protein